MDTSLTARLATAVARALPGFRMGHRSHEPLPTCHVRSRPAWPVPAASGRKLLAPGALGAFATAAALLALLVLAPSPVLAQAPPATPDSVAVKRADGTLTASWDAVDGATSYWITYSSDGGASWSLAARNHTRASITVSPVTNSATYIVGVRACNDHGDSGWRNSPAAGPFVPNISATLTIGDAKADEGDAITFTVKLDNAVPGGFTVTPAYTDGTATSGTDYTANTSAIAFSGTAGETQTFTVSTSDDEDAEDDETFTVGLSVSGTEHDVTAGDTATGTITNDDRAAATPAVTLSVNPSSVSEDAGSTSVTVTATATAAVAVNTPVTVSIGGGTATSGTDYTAVTELALEIPAGGATGRGAFKLTPIDDTEVEGKETISISGSASGLSVTGTSLTLTDKEEASAEWWFGARLSVSPGSV